MAQLLLCWFGAAGDTGMYECRDARVLPARRPFALRFAQGAARGSTSLTTNASGGVVSEIRYTAWGEVRYASGATPTDYKYTGQLETDIGIYYFVARFFDPSIGRFLSPDSTIPRTGNPLAWDRFMYSYGNPVRYVDPSGHSACDGPNGGDPDCDQSKPEFIGISEPLVKILVTLMAFESSSGQVPDNVTYMKSWALLNLHSYNTRNQLNRTPLGNWRGHESKLLNDLGITGNDTNQIAKILGRYQDYISDNDLYISSERFAQIESITRQAVNAWYRNGTNSEADPVNGATGFTDSAGLHYSSGSLDDPLLGNLPNLYEVNTDYAKIKNFRQIYSCTGVVSQLYDYSVHPQTNQPTWTFTWFKY